MINNINKIKKLRVCVVGDVIIDEYINSNVLGASNEEPCLVLNPISSERYIGGAGIVAVTSALWVPKLIYLAQLEKIKIVNLLKKS